MKYLLNTSYIFYIICRIFVLYPISFTHTYAIFTINKTLIINEKLSITVLNI